MTVMWSVLGLSCCSLLMVSVGAFSMVLVLMFLIRMLHHQNTRENAGLTVDLSVSKIDDNGFISLELKPEISVPIPAGTQEGVGRRCRNLQHSGSKIGVWKHPPP